MEKRNALQPRPPASAEIVHTRLIAASQFTANRDAGCRYYANGALATTFTPEMTPVAAFCTC